MMKRRSAKTTVKSVFSRLVKAVRGKKKAAPRNTVKIITAKNTSPKKKRANKATVKPEVATPKKQLTKKKVVAKKKAKLKQATTKNKIIKKSIILKTPASTKRDGIKTKQAVKSTPLAKLLDQQRELLRPPKQANPIIAMTLLEIAKALPGNAIAPGGSFAKGTSLRGTHDVDVFVRFPKGTADTLMSENLRKAFPKAEVLHGSRDYLQMTRGGIVFEIVPVHHVEQAHEISNVTDMSPLHVTYVQSHLTPVQKDDVRLLKQFCKAAGVYGAESHVRGFSGYVLELLVAEYGSFEKFLKAMGTWEGRIVLDPAKAYPSVAAAILRLNESKLGPLVLVDPLDKNRNASAAISINSILLLQERAAAFLAKPSKEFFDAAVYPNKIRAAWKPATVVFARISTPKGRQDIVGSKVLANHEQVLLALATSEFPVLHSEWRFNEKVSICWYVLASTTMPAMKEQRGPPETMLEASLAFKRAHRNARARDGRWYAEVPRAHTNAVSAIKSSLTGVKFTLDVPRDIQHLFKKSLSSIQEQKR